MSLRQYLTIATSFLALTFFWMYRYVAKQRDILKAESKQLQLQLNAMQQATEKLNANNKALTNKLGKALDELNSNACGKEQVPSYLLQKQKELLK